MNKLYSEGLFLLILHIHVHILLKSERESGGVEFSQSLIESKHAARPRVYRSMAQTAGIVCQTSEAWTRLS